MSLRKEGASGRDGFTVQPRSLLRPRHMSVEAAVPAHFLASASHFLRDPGLWDTQPLLLHMCSCQTCRLRTPSSALCSQHSSAWAQDPACCYSPRGACPHCPHSYTKALPSPDTRAASIAKEPFDILSAKTKSIKKFFLSVLKINVVSVGNFSGFYHEYHYYY